MARVLARLRAVFETWAGAETARPTAASTVPLQVRKSLALNSSPAASFEVLVDVRRPDVDPARAVLVGEQLVAPAAAALERPQDLGHLWITELLPTALAALGLVVEADLVARDRDVALLHRRDPVGVVLLRVVLGADPKEAEIQQPDRAGEHPVARQALQREVVRHPLAQLRQRAGEADHRIELLAVATLAPAVVVAVLLAPGIVHPRRLDVAHRIWTDPDFVPGGRDGQLADALHHARLADSPTVLVDVLEPLPAPAPANAGPRAVHTLEPCHLPLMPIRARRQSSGAPLPDRRGATWLGRRPMSAPPG